MMWIVGIIGLAIAAGPPMAAIRNDAIRRALGWLLLATFVTTAHLQLLEASALMRMFGICCVLLASMKGLVYAEWARKERLSIGNYLVFATCWFGMDPVSFRRRKSGLDYKENVAVGLVLMMSGLLACWAVWAWGLHHILLSFVPLSIAFHFGFLRLMKATLRCAGYPVRTLFPNVLKATGVGDFWSRRWNVGYSQMMQRLVGRPASRMAGESAGIMAVFIGSGLLHELAITLPVRAGYGLPTLFFTAHGLLTLLERKWDRSLSGPVALLAVALPLGILFPREFQDEVILVVLSWFEFGG